MKLLQHYFLKSPEDSYRCKRKGIKMKRQKIARLLLSMTVAGTLFLTSIIPAFAQGDVSVEQIPSDNEALQEEALSEKEIPEDSLETATASQMTNLAQNSSYTYSAETLYNITQTQSLSTAYSLDPARTKLTDGIKSSGGSINLDNGVNFYSNPGYNDGHSTSFVADNTVTFDLGGAKTIYQVNAYSGKNVTGRFNGTLGHIGKYSVYVSSDNQNWIRVLNEKDCGDNVSSTTGAYVAEYNVATDGVPGAAGATGIYARYVRIVFAADKVWGNDSYLIGEEVEIFGENGKASGAYVPPSSSSPDVPVNLAANATYDYTAETLYNITQTQSLSTSYALDNNRTKLTDGIKSVNGVLAQADAVNFYSNPNYNAGHGTSFTATNVVNFDLGEAKTIYEVNTYSANKVPLSWGTEALGHIGKYSVYVSSDNLNWTQVLNQKDCGDNVCEATGGYVAEYSVATDGIPSTSTADGIYARYVRIAFEAASLLSNGPYVIGEEVEIIGVDGQAENSYIPPSSDVPSIDEAVNLALDSSYDYTAETLYNITQTQTLSVAYSLDNNRTKLTDGIKSANGSINLDNGVNFYSNPAYNSGHSTTFSAENTVDFDLGSKKTIYQVNAYSSKAVTGRFNDTLGHIGKYSVYVSNNKVNWIPVLSQKNCGNNLSSETGAYVAGYDAFSDGVPGLITANGIYARYVRIVFEAASTYANGSYVVGEEVEILGFDEKVSGSYEPSDEILPEADPNYPNNIAYKKPYTVVNGYPSSDGTYPDTGNKELTDGKVASTSYTDSAWSGYSGLAYRDFIIDLGRLSSVSELYVDVLVSPSVAIRLPGKIDVAFSLDNENWSSFRNAVGIPEDPTTIQKVLLNWKASEEDRITKKEGETTASVTARYVKLHIPMGSWTFIDEIRVMGTYGTADDAVTLPIDTPTTLSYMQKGPHTADIGNLILIYNGYYADGSGDWSVSDYAPFFVHEDPETGEKDTMFDGALVLALGTENGTRSFQGTTQATAAIASDYVWYLNKTLGADGDVAHMNEAARLAGEKLNDPNFKMKVVLTIPGVPEYQNNFGVLPGTTKNLNFSPTSNPNGYAQDQLAAMTWYTDHMLSMWEAGNFEHLDLVGVYLISEAITKMTPALTFVKDFSDEHNLKYFWIPYSGAAGYSQWEKWGFDAVAYQPNYSFATDTTTIRLKNAADVAIEYGMGIELELSGISSAGTITDDAFNRYMEYLEAGVEYGFDGDKSYKAYYDSVCAFRYAAESDDPRVRYVYDATYQFLKGTYQRGYLQYLTEDNVTASDIPHINSAITSINQRMSIATGETVTYLNAEKARLNALKSLVS